MSVRISRALPPYLICCFVSATSFSLTIRITYGANIVNILSDSINWDFDLLAIMRAYGANAAHKSGNNDDEINIQSQQDNFEENVW